MLTPYDVYEKYLAIRMHFVNLNYDYFKYHGKVKSNKETFNKRKDRYFFERLSRKKNEAQVIEYFVSNFIESSDPSKMWVGEMKDKGEENYINWKGRIQSLTYIFKKDIGTLTEDCHLFEAITSKTNSHPKIIKYYLSNKISPETLVILDDITNFSGRLKEAEGYDPVLSITMSKIRKYKNFISYDKNYFLSYIKENFLTK